MGEAVNLVDAFRIIGPPTDDPAADARLQEAQELVYNELQRQARRLQGSGSFSDALARQECSDSVSDVFIHILQSGPRGLREGDPDSDLRVQGYLRRAIHNGTIDRLRAISRTEDVDDENRAQEFSTEAPPQFEDDVHVLLAEGHRLLDDILVPEAITRARRVDLKKSLQRDLEELKRIRATPSLLAAQIQEAAGSTSASGDAAWRTAANRLYQRYGRCLERLGLVRLALVDEGRLEAPQAESLAAVLDTLRPKASVSDRGSDKG
jgi:DNA-directed RNA polymerase specialized sigma24 family protein